MEYKIGDKVLDRVYDKEGEIIAISTAHLDSTFKEKKLYKVKFIENTMFGKKEKTKWISAGWIDIISSSSK